MYILNKILGLNLGYIANNALLECLGGVEYFKCKGGISRN